MTLWPKQTLFWIKTNKIAKNLAYWTKNEIHNFGRNLDIIFWTKLVISDGTKNDILAKIFLVPRHAGAQYKISADLKSTFH